MDEQQRSELFCQEVDELVAGRDVAAEEGLPALAAEMILPVSVQPSIQFSQRLHQRLVTEPSRRSQLWRSWSLIGAAITVLLVVALALVWTPQSLSAAEVLERYGETVPLKAGQVIHEVILMDDKVDWWSKRDPDPSTVQESWQLVLGDDVQRDEIINVGTVYWADDSEKEEPLNDFVFSQERVCFHQYDGKSIRLENGNWIVVDSCYCEDNSQFSYNPPSSGDYFQDWLERARENLPNVRYAKTRWEGRKVHRLSMSGVMTQTKTSCYGDGCVGEQYTVDYKSTVYLDRETYLPVAVEYEQNGDAIIVTYLTYEVLEPEELPADLFVWPAGPCEERE